MTLLQDLQEPFAPNEIHWRVGTVMKNGAKCTLLAYIDARAVMDRLDEVVGPERWSDNYREGAAGGLICRLDVLCVSDTLVGAVHSWVSKEDGAENTNIEAVKGGLSDAFKRAGVKWGIGRYLYRLETKWHPIKEGWANGNGVDVSQSGKGHIGWCNFPQLPPFAMPRERKETVSETQVRQGKHDDEWPKDRGWFHAQIAEFLWDHDSLWAECDDPKGIFGKVIKYPSAWERKGRERFLQKLGDVDYPLGPLVPKK